MNTPAPRQNKKKKQKKKNKQTNKQNQNVKYFKIIILRL